MAASKPERHGLKYTFAAAGIMSNLGVAYIFYYVLYPLAIWKLGIVIGGILMTSASFISCYLALTLYGRMKKDWFGIEALKEKLKNFGAGSKNGRLSVWAMKKCAPLTLVGLSIKFDPLITTVCMRTRAHVDGGLTRSDWLVFISSVLISNGYWLFVMYVGGAMLKHL